MNDRIYQDIYELIEPTLPNNWSKVVYRADYTEDSFSMKYYVDTGNGTYIDCYNLPDVSKSQLISLFIDINRRLSSERNALPDNNKWYVMTMIFDSSGKFKSAFDYSDISENMISYQRDWEKQYLK